MPVGPTPAPLEGSDAAARRVNVTGRRALLALTRYIAALEDQVDQALARGDGIAVAAVQKQAAEDARQLRLSEDGLRHVSLAASTIGRPPDSAEVERLTARQRDVAVCIAEGLSNEAIADRLGVTAGTAANYVKHILERLGLRSRAQIAVWAVECDLYRSGQGWVQPRPSPLAIDVVVVAVLNQGYGGILMAAALV